MNSSPVMTELASRSTWPTWLVTLFVLGFVVAFFWAWYTTHHMNDYYNRLNNHRIAWRHLAKMAPTLADRKVFGKTHSEDGYPLPSNQQAIDIDRVIKAGEACEQREKYSRKYHELKDLDKILAPMQKQEDKDSDEHNNG